MKRLQSLTAILLVCAMCISLMACSRQNPPTDPSQTQPTTDTSPTDPTTPEPTNPEPTNPEPTTPEPTTPEPTTPQPTEPTVPVDGAPTLNVSATTVEGAVRTEITLPTVTATDAEDGDLTASVRMKILFETDSVYVLPKVNATVGVAASEYPTYTPSKVGSYKITYFVKDSAGQETHVEVKLLVSANTEDELGQNLAGKNTMENWIVCDANQNSVINEYGEIVIVGKPGQNYTGAVYQGQKIQNGDTVAFSFVAQPRSEIMFYNVSFLMTPSYNQSKPGVDEGTWPKYFNMRIGDAVETFVVTDNNVNLDLFPSIGLNLLDGKEHTIAIKIDVDDEKVTAKLWIDADTSAAPSQTNTVYRSAVEAKYGADSANLKLFNKNISGWLSFGAFVTGPDTSNDGMVLKSLSINGSNAILTPELKVGTFDKMLLGQEYTLPTVTARDANDYSDISSLVKIYVKAPDGEFTELKTGTFTPEVAGKYTFRYIAIDRSGNQGYAEYVVNCSKGESEGGPVITFADDVKDLYTVQVNGTLRVPVPTSVKDSFGDDLSSQLRISLIGREKATMAPGEAYTFHAAGLNTLRYEVEDYNGNVTQRDITILVEGIASGNIFEQKDSWYTTSGASLSNGIMTVSSGGTTFTYAGQKVYDEKISMRLNLDVMGASGNDGTGILLINIRGGKGLNKLPQSGLYPDGSNDFAWPEGMTLLISNLYGVILKGSGYNSSDYAVAQLPAGNVYDTFNGKDVDLSFQATDVYDENGNFKGIRFQLWLDGERINWAGGAADENGDIFLTSRVVRINENLTQAGWLSFFFNEADTVNGEKTVIKALTIDGTKPLQMVVTMDKEEDQLFTMGQEYTLPVMKLVNDGVDVSDQVRKFIWIEGTQKPDLTGEGYTALTIATDNRHSKGFTVIYVYEGKEIRSIPVSCISIVNVSLTLDKESYTAVFGEDFTLPVYTALEVGEDVTDRVVVMLQTSFGEVDVTGQTVYRPTGTEAFKLKYYLDGDLLKVQVVEVTIPTKNITAEGHVTDGGAWVYTAEQIYNSVVTLKFKLNSPMESQNFIDFALRGNSQNPDDLFHYQNGLVLRFEKNATWGTFIKIGYGGDDGWFDAAYGESIRKFDSIDWTQEHTITYTVQDIYNGDTFVGIRIDVAFDGEAITFKDMNYAGYISTSDGTYLLIPASYLKTAPADRFTPSYLFAWSHGNKVVVTEAHLGDLGGKKGDIPTEPGEDEKRDNIATEGHVTGSGAWAYTIKQIYNADIEVKFTLDAQLEAGNWIDFALRGNSQDAGDWFHYQNGLVLRMKKDATWGTFIQVGHGGANGWFGAIYGESNRKFDDIDWTKEHTIGYTVEDVYEGETFVGIRITVTFDGEALTFKDMSNAGYTSTSDGTYLLIPASYLEQESAPADLRTPSYLFAWGNGKNITVTEAYLKDLGQNEEEEKPGEEENPDNIASQGHVTGGGAWAYTTKQIYNAGVTVKFTLDAQLEANNWIDFALRGNVQDAGDWFHFQNGLVLRMKKDATWGTFIQVGYGGADGWFDAIYGESNRKFDDIDWTKEHTMGYTVEDIYEGETFVGIRITVTFDGEVITFKDMSSAGYTSTSDGTYLLIPASYLEQEAAPADLRTPSYLFVWGNGKTVTVTEAYLTNLSNLVSKGHVTGGGAWAYTTKQIYNADIEVKFTLDAQLEANNWIDFALRGNVQDAGDWFHFQNGLVLRMKKDATWGTFIQVGYGGADGWFDAIYGESNRKFDDIDWTKEHTMGYTVEDIYEGETFVGIRITVTFDGEVITFKDMSSAGYTSTSDGTYLLIPASYLETAPADRFTASYLFVWSNGKNVTVKEAYITER